MPLLQTLSTAAVQGKHSPCLVPALNLTAGWLGVLLVALMVMTYVFDESSLAAVSAATSNA